jgi:aminoglycoside phosphotransferase
VDPTLELLTGDRAQDVLAAALGSAGGELVEWRASQVDHRPGSYTTVAYSTVVRWGDVVQAETLAASSGLWNGTDAPPGVLVLGDGEHQVAVWRFPVDPALPALAEACDATAVAGLLRSLGVSGAAADAQSVRLTIRSYRPRRRAVVEVQAGPLRLFLKVLRPPAVADMHRRHRLLHDAGLPVPRSLGWTDDGLLVLEAISGLSMRRQLLDGAAVPPGRVLTRLLDLLPSRAMELPMHEAWADNAEHYARVVGDAVPDERARASQLAGRIHHGLAGRPAEVPTHGDFYDGQLLLRGDRVSGLLDVDIVGPGRREDDLACLLAHTEVLALTGRGKERHIRGSLAVWLASFQADVDPVELRLRTAGVLMSLATGPHRVQERGWRRGTTVRLDAVERWVASADAVSC